MIHALSRRLRVRDDGTGKSRDVHSTFADFETEDAIILLGDPGMGKTTFFKEAAESTSYTTVRKFLVDPIAATREVLFLDALDEYRTIASGQDASAELAKALCSLKKPKFRLSCRAADWFGSRDQDVLSAASASGRVVILELCPLSRDEILNAVQQLVRNPGTFLDEAEAAGLGKLLGNPQTLKLVTLAWGTSNKPRNKFEAYEIGVSELLKETNTQHIARGLPTPDPNDLLKAAGAATSTLLLSNSVGISRAEPADGDGYVKFSVVPYPNRGDLDAVLRRLFISSEVDRFEPVHRTIAEFLAAEDLSHRIMKGLPIDRVMALMCGVDGKPISSLRGLFAWLICKLGHLAEGFVDRDPYGVSTYGDASVLPPNVQRAVWTGLRELHDPWFLANEDDRGSFRGLANLNTAKIIREILRDPATGVHLKIAALEAIANSTGNLGLNKITRAMVSEKNDNTWIRSTALRAFAKSVQNDWTQLNALDAELVQAIDDLDASEVRAELLHMTRTHGSLPQRLLSIMEQADSAKKKGGVFGRFRRLRALPPDTDLDEILDGASGVLMRMAKDEDRFEVQSIFDKWLKRRLDTSAPITPQQMTKWLRSIRIGRDHHPEKPLASLKARFEQDPSLFQKVFELLANVVPGPQRSFSLFLAVDLWKLLPRTVWPVSQCEFFLAFAEKENNLERAADFFHMYLSWFPSDGASVALAEAGFYLLDRRPDVAKVLGNWNICEGGDWRKDQFERREEKNRKSAANRIHNVSYLMPRLTTIREGDEENALAWAALVYEGLFHDLEDISDPRDRLIRATNEEIADAIIEGFIWYAENQTIPKMEAVIQSWCANSIPYTHTLLALSVFLRLRADMTVPTGALPNCIAAVVTNLHTGDRVPEWNEMLSKWLPQEVDRNPSVVCSVLKELWVAGAATRKGDLPGFYELNADPNCQQLLASLSAEVLKTGINEDHYTVHKLVSVLLLHDRQTALEIGTTELPRAELSTEVRAIWSTALFAIDPSKYLAAWRTLMAGPDEALWQAVDVIGGSQHGKRGSARLTPEQRTEVIVSLGRRFANVEHPSGGWSGSQNPWDASEFVGNQIKLLATDNSPDIDSCLQRLENDIGLASYRDLIRHQRAQYQKQQRESSFAFVSPEEVAEAIANRAPATPRDLLAFIVDHLNALSHELARTQRERYRAYWNQSGRKLVKPKHEEDCSGQLAEDLQNRVQAQSLIVTVEHHMIADKECDLVVLQGTERLLPIEVKHHYHAELWTAWRTQLDRLYTRDAKAGGLGIYLVLWSGEANGRTEPVNEMRHARLRN